MAMTTRLGVVLLTLVLAVAACLVALMWAKAPPASAQEDNEPSFGVRCAFSHRNSDDPIVHPGTPGAAHSHDFFGNTSTDASSTYDSLRAAGTTCTRAADTAAYWIPTVMWEGKNLKASRSVIYYRGNRKDHTKIQAPPAGLKVVPNTHVTWRCVGETPYAQDPPTKCSNGTLGVRIVFPDCLATGETGKPLLDSADHRSHMTYRKRQSDGTTQCPSTHPIPIPALHLVIEFPIPTTPGQVTLASDHPGEHGDSMHADFFNAWDQAVLEGLVKTCINGFDPSLPEPRECKTISGR
jgi:uncharacterized protein DUF1996